MTDPESAVDQALVQEVYERGEELAESFDYEYEDLVGVTHGFDHLPSEGRPAHWVEAVVEIDIKESPDSDVPYADESVSRLIADARDLGLVPTSMRVLSGHPARSERTKDSPSSKPRDADVDSCVVVEFGLINEVN